MLKRFASRMALIFLALTATGMLAGIVHAQSTEAPATEAPATPSPSPTPAPQQEDQKSMNNEADDDISLGEIPMIETTELALEKTKAALDVYGTLREKYKDAGVDQYEDLQDFVNKSPDGKQLEADIKAAGFASVDEWNLIITTASLTYANIVDDQTEDIKSQIEEIKQNDELAQDMKDRLIKSLNAMIPSDNNQKVVDTLMNDPTYGEKIKSLEIEEE